MGYQLEFDDDLNYEDLCRLLRHDNASNEAFVGNFIAGVSRVLKKSVTQQPKNNIVTKENRETFEDEHEVVKKALEEMVYVKYSKRTVSVDTGFNGNMREYLILLKDTIDSMGVKIHNQLNNEIKFIGKVIKSKTLEEAVLLNDDNNKISESMKSFLKNKEDFYDKRSVKSISRLNKVVNNISDLNSLFNTAYGANIDKDMLEDISSKANTLSDLFEDLVNQFKDISDKDKVTMQALSTMAYNTAAYIEFNSLLVFQYITTVQLALGIHSTIALDFS